MSTNTLLTISKVEACDFSIQRDQQDKFLELSYKYTV